MAQLLERLVAKQVRRESQGTGPRLNGLSAPLWFGSSPLLPFDRFALLTPISTAVRAPHIAVLQIWTDRDQWRGFLLCADHMRSDAYTPLLQLPEAVMEVTLLGAASSEGARSQGARMGLAPGCQLPLASGARLAVYVLQPAANQPPIPNVLITHQVSCSCWLT